MGVGWELCKSFKHHLNYHGKTTDQNTHASITSCDACFMVQTSGFYPRNVVSAVYATVMWLGGWLGGCLSVTAGIVSRRLNLS